jgi:hypothetical protein
MRNRKDILTDLVFLKGDLSELQNELLQYSWDAEKPTLIIGKQDFSNVLKRCIENEINFEDLVSWANVIECRDDLDFEVEEMQEIVFELVPALRSLITNRAALCDGIPALRSLITNRVALCDGLPTSQSPTPARILLRDSLKNKRSCSFFVIFV